MHALSHLQPDDITNFALVCQRFHDLVTSQHAWRAAFARYFPGPETIDARSAAGSSVDKQGGLRSARRAFARLTALASWRSEYVIRTRLLRSLARGKPTSVASATRGRNGSKQAVTAIADYKSQLFTPVNHLHVSWGTDSTKHSPRFMHGADYVGAATSSDPATRKVDTWGTSDPLFFLPFAERFPGDAQWGLGAGELVGNPNVMDISQPYGMVVGEGCPGGSAYYRSAEEQRGRFITVASEFPDLNLGIPHFPSSMESVGAVWIAKSNTIPSLSDGLIGMLLGSSTGSVTAYSLGSDSLRHQHLARGEQTAKWVLSPGVPIIAVSVDSSYSIKRQAQNRIWAVALNALGEVFYLTKFPKRPVIDRSVKLDTESLDKLAWATGRTVYWNSVDLSRRSAKEDPYGDTLVDGSYSPRSSWNGMCLNQEQVAAETREIQDYLRKLPKDFQKACHGWDMRRRLEVDFAGDDGHYAGETVAVIDCGLDEASMPGIKRYTRCRFAKEVGFAAIGRFPLSPPRTPPSIFGGSASPRNTLADQTRSAQQSVEHSPERPALTEEWRCSRFSFVGHKSPAITTSTIDTSIFANTTISEDPLRQLNQPSATTSPFATPQGDLDERSATADIPGQRGRFLAVGTKTGAVFLWDLRAAMPKSAEFVNTIDPVRIIYTDSPEISSLALNGLYLVHGGSDGLVQAWDPLASTTTSIRTLHSRFTGPARRQLAQAQAAAPNAIHVNMYAAAAIALDPDSTVLRGVVSLGNHLRYWHYSSSAADKYKGQKRRLRRSERGSNNGSPLAAANPRSRAALMGEVLEYKSQVEERRREADKIAGRFGTELLDNEAEAVAYAALLSQEAFEAEARRRESISSASVDTPSSDAVSSGTATPEGSAWGRSPSPLKAISDEAFEDDLDKAIRLSLEETSASPPIGSYSSSPGGFEFAIKQAKPKRNRKSGTRSSKASPLMAAAGSSNAQEMTDLDLAMQLSLAEEQSRIETGGSRSHDADAPQEFPSLNPGSDAKGKRRA